VQLLKYVGAHVTAVCNTKNVELVRSLGADVVVDYQTQDFRQTQTRFDFIFDAVGKSSFKQCKPLLKKKGIYISTELGKRGVNIWLALTTPLWGGKRLLFPLPLMHKEDAVFFKILAEAGKFKPVIDRTYDLDQIVEAHTYAQSGQKTGNVVVRLV
jgi:NADPH:quinone reductase-like Zn-dependent oxidoreductase